MAKQIRSKLVLNTVSIEKAKAISDYPVEAGELFVQQRNDTDSYAKIETLDANNEIATYRPETYYAPQLLKLKKQVFPLKVSASIVGDSVFKVGDVKDVTVKWNSTQGNDAATGLTSVTVAGEAISGNPASGSKTYTGVSANTDYNVSIVDSDGQTASAGAGVRFVYSSYFGVIAADFVASESAIKALTPSIKNTRYFETPSFTQTVEKNCYAYPQGFGLLTSITDGKNAYLNSYERIDDVTIDGQPYYIYLLKDPSSLTNYKLIFS